MLDKSINGALLALRKQIIRGDGDGLAHVEALLAMRGVELPRVMPAKRKDVARSGHMRHWIREALSDGPKPLCDIVTHISAKRPDLDAEYVFGCAVRVIVKMKAGGLLVRSSRADGCLWRLR